MIIRSKITITFPLLLVAVIINLPLLLVAVTVNLETITSLQNWIQNRQELLNKITKRKFVLERNEEEMGKRKIGIWVERGEDERKSLREGSWSNEKRGVQDWFLICYYPIFSVYKNLFFNLKSQPLNIFLPHVLHPNLKWSKWSLA